MANLLLDPSFETPTTSNLTYTPTGTAWTYTGDAGVSANAGSFGGSLAAPDGVQTGFVQQTGSLVQTITVPSTANYILTFEACQISFNRQDFAVQMDGVTVGRYRPGIAFSTYTLPMNLTSGTHVLGFVGLNTVGGDNVALLDNVILQTGGSGPPTAVPNGQTVLANAATFRYSPYAFFPLNTSDMGCNTPGNYIKTLFSGQSCTLLFNSIFQGTNFAQILYRVDNLDWISVEASEAIDATNGVPLFAGLHVLEIVISYFRGNDCWNTLPFQSGTVFEGIQIDTGATAYLPAARKYNVLVYGDSFCAGVNAYGSGINAAEGSFAYNLGHALDAEVGVICSPGQGYTAVGSNNYPVFVSSWDHYYSGASRLVGGQYSPLPDLVYLAEGNNDGNTSAVETACQTVLTGMLAAGAKKILPQNCPYTNGLADPQITAAITAVKSPNVYPIMPASVIDFADAPAGSVIGSHPTASFHEGYYLPRVVNYINTNGYLGGSGSGVYPSPADVRLSTAYGSTGSNETGTLAVPTASHVLLGIAVDATTGNVTLPSAATVESGTTYGPSLSLTGTYSSGGGSGVYPSPTDVRLATTYGSTGTNETGSLHVPTASQVLLGIAVDATTGNVTLPNISTVESGTTFGPSLSLTGTYSGGGGSSGATLAQITELLAEGVTLASAGLDEITIESGINARQALTTILAANAGVVSGAGSGEVTIKGANTTTTRIAASTDDNGNRTSVTLTMPE